MMSFQKIYSPTQLANAMKLVRQQNGWTQSELAKKIGIKQATISNFENNPDFGDSKGAEIPGSADA